MIRARLHRRVALIGACLSLCAAVPAAQSSAILGKDDDVYAMKLAAAGYTDLSRLLLDVSDKNAKGDRGSREALLGSKALRLRLELDAAQAERDPDRRIAALQNGIALAKAFATDEAGSPAAEQVRMEIPAVQLQLGEVILAILKASEEPSESATALRKTALETVREAATTLREYLRDEPDQPVTGEDVETGQSNAEAEPDPAAKEAAEAAAALREGIWFDLGRSHYLLSLLLGPETDAARRERKVALNAFEDFELEYQGSLNTLIGSIYIGLCLRDDGDVRGAIDTFDATIAMKELYELGKDGTYEVSPEAAEVISQAVQQKILLLVQEGDHAEAAATAEDFLKTVRGARSTSQAGFASAALAESLEAARKPKQAADAAREALAANASGQSAYRARRVLYRLGAELDPQGMLDLAQDGLGAGDLQGSLEACRRAVALARGTPQEAEIGAAAYELMGGAYLNRGRTLEAAAAYEAAAELFPRAERAPVVMQRAAGVLLDLSNQEQQPYFRARADAQIRALAESHPDHPLAARTSFIDARALEKQERWTDAAALYRKVPADSSEYDEAQYRLAVCLHRAHRPALVAAASSESARAEAKAAVEEARAAAGRARAGAERRSSGSLGGQSGSFAGVAFNSAVLEVQCLLDLDRPAETTPLLDDVERLSAGDPDRTARAWGLRVVVLLRQGSVDVAQRRFETAPVAVRTSAAGASAAFQLATALDEQAAAIAGQDDYKSKALAHAAATCYSASVAAALAGGPVDDLARVDSVADRLFALGMRFNGVTDVVETLLEWGRPAPHDPEAWEDAANVYSLALAQQPSRSRELQLARVSGLLARYDQAAAAYARIFAEVEIFLREGTRVRLNPSIVRNDLELVSAYLEFAIAEHRTGLAGGQQATMERASTRIGELGVALRSSSADTRFYWRVKYAQLRTFQDRGMYVEAKLLIDDLERTTGNFDGGEFGFQERFLKARAEMK